MIRIETKIDDKDRFEINYAIENGNTMEHLLLISRLVDIILENEKNINEKEIIKFIKKRKKYMEEV